MFSFHSPNGLYSTVSFTNVGALSFTSSSSTSILCKKKIKEIHDHKLTLDMLDRYATTSLSQSRVFYDKLEPTSVDSARGIKLVIPTIMTFWTGWTKEFTIGLSGKVCPYKSF